MSLKLRIVVTFFALDKKAIRSAIRKNFEKFSRVLNPDLYNTFTFTFITFNSSFWKIPERITLKFGTTLPFRACVFTQKGMWIIQSDLFILPLKTYFVSSFTDGSPKPQNGLHLKRVIQLKFEIQKFEIKILRSKTLTKKWDGKILSDS